YTLRLAVTGDVNGDQKVDGLDSELLAQAFGSSAGDPGYLSSADADADGHIDATDVQLAGHNFGFAANQAPRVLLDTLGTHSDLAVSTNLTDIARDPEDDPITVRVVGTDHGTALVARDGQSVTFLPAAGFSGTASFQVQADDGYGPSVPGQVVVNVSGAP